MAAHSSRTRGPRTAANAPQAAPRRRALPTRDTSFVGRGPQLAAVGELLRRHRLLTLTGPPGTGKTRLSIQAAAALVDEFPDGVYFVGLASIQDPDLVAAKVAEAIGIAEDPARPFASVVGDHIAERATLLVLDNFEHVLAAAPTLAEWLSLAPALRLMVTSRAPLQLSGEHEFSVPPLELPSDALEQDEVAASEAVQLFVQRAQAAQPDFAPSASTLATMAAICRRLDGLPLAIELAAARVKLLSLQAILSRLDHRLSLLTGGARDLPPRHRSLRAAISWSYELLTGADQAFFRRLSVFEGGWSLAAAESVSAVPHTAALDPLDGLGMLLDESLIQRVHTDEEPRYQMLETLREYARDELAEAGELQAVAQRHATYFLELAERAEPELTRPGQREWLDLLAVEHDNLRAALRWALTSGEVEIGLRLGIALWRFWQIRGHIVEGRTWMSELLGHEDRGDARLRARALSAAGSLAYWQNDQADARRFYEESIRLRRELGDPVEVAMGLYELAFSYATPSSVPWDLKRATLLANEALALARGSSDAEAVARVVWLLGWIAFVAADNTLAVSRLRDSVELFRPLEDPFGLAWALHVLGQAEMRLGEFEAADEHWREALTLFQAAVDVSGIAFLLDDFAAIAIVRGDAHRAIRLRAAAAGLRGSSGALLADMSQSLLASTLRELEQRSQTGGRVVSRAVSEAAWREGTAMPLQDAVVYALDPSSWDRSHAMASALRVYALGPMRVERDGQPILHWGGEKAGSRQAQAIFAFLFDRGEVGVAKDDFTELLWPDLPLRRADLAFHRTLAGLRGVLESGSERLQAINHRGGRYRLDPGHVSWSDVSAFEEGLAAAGAAQDPGAAIVELEAARELYRGLYLDDCPFYGDSAEVEARRSYLAGRLVDALVLLGQRHAERGDRASAAACFREAVARAPESASAAEGLASLGGASADMAVDVERGQADAMLPGGRL